MCDIFVLYWHKHVAPIVHQKASKTYENGLEKHENRLEKHENGLEQHENGLEQQAKHMKIG